MSALVNLVYLVFLALIFVGVKFVLQPYKNWQRQKKRNGGIFESKIVTVKKTYKYSEYVENVSSKKKVDLSLIIPAYNEEQRLPPMLKDTIPYFEKYGLKYEIIVANDASKDNTTKTALGFSEFENKNIDISVIELNKNAGKGGAIRLGMLLATGTYKLFLDADGATRIKEFDKVYKEMKGIEKQIGGKNFGIVAGSRNHLQKDVVKQRKWYRNILMHISNFIVNVICGVKLKDTQCGFKLFTNESADIIFNVLHLERWAFDVELFMIGDSFKMPVKEIPVDWQDIDGSKLNVVEASITMARDFLILRILYLFRMWRFNDTIYRN